MARENKFNLVAETDIAKSSRSDGIFYRVSIIRSKFIRPDGKEQVQYSLRFPREVLWMYDLTGKRIKLYIDAAKKVIAWRVLEGNTTLEELQLGREIKPDTTNGSWTTSVGKLIHSVKIDMKETRSKIPVKEYTQNDLGVLTKFWYIEL